MGIQWLIVFLFRVLYSIKTQILKVNRSKDHLNILSSHSTKVEIRSEVNLNNLHKYTLKFNFFRSYKILTSYINMIIYLILLIRTDKLSTIASFDFCIPCRAIGFRHIS